MNVAYGLYRFEDVTHTAHDQFAEAVLRVGMGAHLTGDAVLAFHELALVVPRRIRVGTDRRVRANLPEWIHVVREELPEDDLTIYEGVRSAHFDLVGTRRVGAAVAVSPVGLARARSRPVNRSTTSAASKTR